jgi:hypothetical protein
MLKLGKTLCVSRIGTKCTNWEKWCSTYYVLHDKACCEELTPNKPTCVRIEIGLCSHDIDIITNSIRRGAYVIT